MAARPRLKKLGKAEPTEAPSRGMAAIGKAEGSTQGPQRGAPVAPVGLLQAVVVGDVNFVNLPGALVVGQIFPLD